MAIITDSIVDVGSYTTFNIGLSKAISNYTADEVWNFPYCSSQWEYYKHIGRFDTKPLMDFAPGGTGEGMNKLFPLKYTGRNDMYYPQTYWFDPGEIEYNNPDGIYCRVIWLYGTDEQISNLLTGKRRSIYGTDGFKIVTQMDMTKVFIFLDNFVLEPYSNSANPNNINKLNYDNFKIKEDHDGTTSYSHPRNCSIFPVVMFKENNKLYLHLLFQRMYESLDWSWGLNASQNESPDHAQGWEWDAQPTSFDGTEGCYFPVNIGRDFGGLRPGSVESFHTPTDIPDIGAMYQWYYYSQTGGRINPVTEQAYLKLASWYGGMFYHDGKYYKPIIEDGYVTGYTDDMSVPSDIDNWIGNTNHDVPPAPPGPGPAPAGDDMDVMNTGATGSSGGFTHFYIMSPQDLIDLLSDFYTRADAGETLSNNLVCSYILGIPSSKWVATEDVPVAIHNSAQGTPFVSVQNYKHVTATNNMLVTGKFDVPRMTNTFYDFSPYSTYEVFIPCCGWVRLPDTVAGRTINVYLYIDIASCCVKGQVMISGSGVCAVVNGALGSPIPMAVIESGILRGNNIQAGMGMIGGAIQTGVSAGSGSFMGVGNGVYHILDGLVNSTVAGNTNYTEQKGGTGDITQFAMGHQCYMKITHPEIDPVVNEYIFGHTVGYLCNTIGQLSNFHGFTMCSNPHINISASDREREEIKQFLEQGVILPYGE